jgi:tetratricopeptide (TPR) repeat protein
MYESQPNYYIFNAFNELAKGKFDDFKKNILLAITKCTDKEILYHLELWNFSYRFRMKDIDQDLMDKINTGLDYEIKYLPNDAITQYEMAKRMGSCALPPFLIGRIKLEIENEAISAERYINDAINIYPGFALARVFNLEMLIKNEQYDIALNEIEAVLNIPNLSIWYIYYLKARVLFLQNNYKGALEIVQNNCSILNSNNFEQFILLGDIYLAQKDCTKAKENFQNAGDIEPDNPKYRDRMQQLFTECNN